MGEFVLDQLLEMKFTFSPSLPGIKQSDVKSATSSKGSLEDSAKANNRLDVSRNKNKEGFKSVVLWAIEVIKLTDFELTVSFKCFRASFEGLVEFLWTQVLSKKNIIEVDKKILQDPEILGQLLTKVAVEKLTEKIVAKLVCRHPDQAKGKENLKGRSKKIQDDKKKERHVSAELRRHSMTTF